MEWSWEDSNFSNSSDPELEKLWQDIDDYCDSDEAHNIATTSNLLPVKEVDGRKAARQKSLEAPGGKSGLALKQTGIDKRSERSTMTDVSLATRGKSCASIDKHMHSNCHLPTLIGKRRRSEDIGLKGTRLLSLSPSSKGSSQTKSTSGMSSSLWDRIKRRPCRKTPLSELNGRSNGEMQKFNARTFESGETHQMKISSTQEKESSRLDNWGQSSCSSNTIEDSDSNGDRERVKKTLNLFRSLCQELLHEGQFRRIDYNAARIIKGKPDFVDLGKFVGSVPGVKVGDEFRYRMEVSIVSLHKPLEAGIDCMRYGTMDICISIVATGCRDYTNDMHNPEVLVYCGQGGNVGRGRKEPEDQRLVKGNLALKNSINARNPVRVVRGKKETGKTPSVYIYDGMYNVETFWQEKAAHGKMVFKFKLRRIPAQPAISREQWMKLGYLE